MKDRNMEEGLDPDCPTKQSIVHETSEAPSTIASFGIPLYSYRAVPSFLQGNPYITEGYRAHLTPKLCVKSAFILSNETVNIWSHLLGLIYFTLLQFEDNIYFLPDHQGSMGDHMTFTIMNLCFQICMFCSSGYHLFNCQSEISSKRWLSLDLAGVSVGMCGCYFPGAYYAFYCHNVCKEVIKFWQSTYMCAMGMLVFVSLFAQAHRDFLSNNWYFRRVALYSAFIFASVVPVMHWLVLSGGFQDPFVQLFMPKIFLMYIITVAGGLFYVSHFPEKAFPGKVNYIGSSHQWWHLMVLSSFVYAHHMGVTVFLYWSSHGCSAQPEQAAPLIARGYLDQHINSHDLSMLTMS